MLKVSLEIDFETQFTGSEKERAVFQYAKTKDYSKADDDEELGRGRFEVTEKDEEDDQTGKTVEVVETKKGAQSEEEDDDESEEEDGEEAGKGTTGNPDAVAPPVIMHFEEVRHRNYQKFPFRAEF